MSQERQRALDQIKEYGGPRHFHCATSEGDAFTRLERRIDELDETLDSLEQSLAQLVDRIAQTTRRINQTAA